MVSTSQIEARQLRQGAAVFLGPGYQRLEDSYVMVGWAKDHPGNLVLQKPGQPKSTIVYMDTPVYVPDGVLLATLTPKRP